MVKVDNRADVEPLKKMLRAGWNRILRRVPDEKVYAFGIYTNECAQSMSPFLLGEKGLQHVAEKYVQKGIFTPQSAADDLRWCTADSPYCSELFKKAYGFEARPDVFSLPSAGMAREVRYRLATASQALKELEEEGLFATAGDRESITLYIEGGGGRSVWKLDRGNGVLGCVKRI